jgi:tetratricopeptide (TPR) repeat protein
MPDSLATRNPPLPEAAKGGRTIDAPLSPALALQLNLVCDRFEAAWKGAARGAPGPQIEEHLPAMPAGGVSVVLRHLLMLEIDYRRLRGERPTAAEYRDRFPTLSERVLREIFPAEPGKDAPASGANGSERPAGVAEPAAEVPDPETTVVTPAFEPQFRGQRYAIRRFHAKGGLGEVWLAEDAEVGRPVALKRLREGREHYKDRFLVEAQITGQLEHPGIVPVHDLGVDEAGRPFYVMSFIHGQTLREALQDYHTNTASGEAREVQFARLLDIFVKVCHAVAYAHHRGVVHRDLKPENIMLGPFGEALVLDWGMAKVCSQVEGVSGAAPVQPTYSSGSVETQDGMVLGSPAYMSPEAAEGRAAEADERTDVYLLGATLYHILTGLPPRQGRSHAEIVELARTMPPPLPRKVKADVPRALEAICMKAMAHRPPDRYASALELAADMERYLAGAPVSAYREPFLARAVRWCRRHRRALGRGAVAAVVLAVIVAGFALIRDARRERDAERLQAEELRRRDQAIRDLGTFQRLAEERYFHQENSTPTGELAVFFDPHHGQGAAQKALDLAERLGRELDELALVDERATLKREVYALLLLTAQNERAPNRQTAPAALERLERAAAVGGASRSYHRLRARCYGALGEEARAAEEKQRAEAATPTALDHYLQGEDFRVRAFDPLEKSDADFDAAPNYKLLRQAIAEYRRVLLLEPDHFWSHLQIGRCYLSLGQGPEAVEALGTCVALKPNRPWGYSARGHVLSRMGRDHYAEAAADLERALSLDGKFRPAILHRGLLAWLQGNDDAALADFEAVLEPPDDQRLVEAYYYCGLLHLRRKEYSDALKQFNKLAKENPNFRPVYLTRAQVLFLRGDDSRGLADLTAFLNLGRTTPFDPKDPQLRARRGRLLLHLVPKWGFSDAEKPAKLKLTWDELETARQQGYRSAELFDALGSVAQLRNDGDAALDAYTSALETAPPNLAVKVRTKRGWTYALYLKRPQYNAARDDFSAALRLDPAHADAHAGLGFVQARENVPGEALREAGLALGYGSDDYLILHNVACIYAELSRVEKSQAKALQDAAMDLLRRAVTLCRRAGDGHQETWNIQHDPSLKVLPQDFFDKLGAEDQ